MAGPAHVLDLTLHDLTSCHEAHANLAQASQMCVEGMVMCQWYYCQSCDAIVSCRYIAAHLFEPALLRCCHCGVALDALPCEEGQQTK